MVRLLYLMAKWVLNHNPKLFGDKLTRYGVPRICFINKINQTGGDFYKSLESIHNRLVNAPSRYTCQLDLNKALMGLSI